MIMRIQKCAIQKSRLFFDNKQSKLPLVMCPMNKKNAANNSPTVWCLLSHGITCAIVLCSNYVLKSTRLTKIALFPFHFILFDLLFLTHTLIFILIRTRLNGSVFLELEISSKNKFESDPKQV